MDIDGKMTKAQADYYLRRCYAVLRDSEAVGRIRLRLMEGWAGLLEPDGTIVLDPREAVLPTVLHECLHELYDRHDYGESVILYMEKKLCELLTPRQWRTLYHRVGEIL